MIFDNKICTYYQNIVDHPIKDNPLLTYPGKKVNMIDLLSKEGYTNHKLLTDLRNSGYKSDFYNKNKRRLSAACFSSVQDDLTIDRSDENHLFHTNFITFDIDVDSNEILKTKGGTDDVKDELINKIPYIAYCGRSVSGIGLWGLIPIKYKDDHIGHYTAMVTMFKDIDVFIDTTVHDVSRLRFLSYDEDAYIELQPDIFAKTELVQTNNKPLFNRLPDKKYETEEIFLAACHWVEAKHEIKFKDGFKHMYLTYLYATLRYARVSRADILNWVYNNLIPENQVNSNCLEEMDIISKV